MIWNYASDLRSPQPHGALGWMGLWELSLCWDDGSFLLPSPRIHPMKIDGRVTCNLGKMIFKSYNLISFWEFSFLFFIFIQFLKYCIIKSFYVSLGGGGKLCVQIQIAVRKLFTRISVSTSVVDRTIQQQSCSLALLKSQLSSLSFPKLPYMYKKAHGGSLTQ